MERISSTARAAYLTLLAGVALAVPLAAQSGGAGQVEIGSYGTLTTYDRDVLGLDSKAGVGGRIGWFFTPAFSVEASGDYTITNAAAGAQVDVTRLGGTLLAHAGFIPLGTPYLGAGYERLFYRGATQGEDDGFHVVLGERLPVGARAALRLEGRLAYFTNTAFDPAGTAKPLNLTASVGVSIFGFGGPSRDSDGDLVANNDDRCPDTPLGARVDREGCPTDGDSDGVFDGIDRCDGTPAGALVDGAGCPKDTDSDGVFDGIDVCPNTPPRAVADANGCPIDTDQDGVFDGLDRCADTPQGATVDDGGCPLDTDGDDVFDGLDRCPDTPVGTPVDINGCPADSDSDGVLDTTDQCPNTPAGVQVDARGCSVDRDTDGDGIPDSLDRCPNTAPGQNVDALGCPVLFVEREGRRMPLRLEGVNFHSNSSALTDESYAVLDGVAQSLVEHSDVRIEIAGHTDSTGPRSLNMRLSSERAQAVKAYLARRGVDPGRMEAVGHGPDQPVATNTTLSGRAQNRRVELRVIEGEQQ